MEQKRRFYQSGLARIVWDAINNRVLAQFVEGQFYTEQKEVAVVLLKLGYKEVGLEDQAPPYISPLPPIVTDNIRVPLTPEQELNQMLVANVLNREMDNDSTELLDPVQDLQEPVKTSGFQRTRKVK